MKADEAISQWAQQGENAVPVPWTGCRKLICIWIRY